MKIYPAILERDLRNISSKLNLAKNLSNKLQIDICDGKFVRSKTYASSGSMRSFLNLSILTSDFKLELDLMIKWTADNFDRWVNSVLEASPKSVVIHKSSITEDDFIDLISILKREKIKIGLGVNLKDKNSEIEKFLPYVNYIQIMGIEKVGYSGQKLSPKVYTKIRHFRKKYPKLKISVDGGVKEDNLEKIFKAGANSVGANSMIFDDKDPKRFF